MVTAPQSRTSLHPDGKAHLTARRLGLHSHGEAVAVIRTDCPVSRSEGLRPHTQVLVTAEGGQVRALLYQIEQPIIGIHEVGLSESAWDRLGLSEGDMIALSHAPPLQSLASVRHRIHGNRLSEAAMASIVEDVAAGNYADVHLAAFLTASSAMPLDDEETYFLTKSMVAAGEQVRWDSALVLDKHSVGGLPGNRTTPIIVAIVASCGLIMPKTSSRAITSPAGTADTMEVMTRVDLDLEAMRTVVAKEGACIAWGGAVSLSPADDIFIGVERMLDIDTEGQLVASVLSKKIAAGSTHVVIDIPVGPTAKVRSEAVADALAERLAHIGSRFGMAIACVESDGTQPVGRGIGPALEAQDVLAVLRRETGAPEDLALRACRLAGALLELGGGAVPGQGLALAREKLESGAAWEKFRNICEAQGGFREPTMAAFQRPLASVRSGRVTHVDNRKVAQLAKLAGAPDVKTAGVAMNVKLGDEVVSGDTLLVVHADTPGDVDYALDYAAANPNMIEID
ncbi:MAG: thymidine phosphorylase family protein [Allosphingosinicella sp.]